MVGLTEVKRNIRGLVELLREVWDAEKRGDRPPVIPKLNQVFVGSPGTGKTTVAKLYAALLKESGFLSRGGLGPLTDILVAPWDVVVLICTLYFTLYTMYIASMFHVCCAGECVDTKPSDYIGVSKGDTVAKTKAVMEQAKGNVLLIDEAYDLDPDAITEIVASAPAEAGVDMAIIMCGYYDKMDEMLRKSNPGLKSRFPEYWLFESYNCGELRRIFFYKTKESMSTSHIIIFPLLMVCNNFDVILCCLRRSKHTI